MNNLDKTPIVLEDNKAYKVEKSTKYHKEFLAAFLISMVVLGLIISIIFICISFNEKLKTDKKDKKEVISFEDDFNSNFFDQSSSNTGKALWIL